jgi:Arc/MetJ-type ribon-helix-helix transcriptional regulator
MTVTLSSTFERFVRKLVETGRYSSEQEAVEAAVANLMLDSVEHLEEEFDDASAASVARSEEQIKGGQVRTLDDAAAQLRQKHFGK